MGPKRCIFQPSPYHNPKTIRFLRPPVRKYISVVVGVLGKVGTRTLFGPLEAIMLLIGGSTNHRCPKQYIFLEKEMSYSHGVATRSPKQDSSPGFPRK